MPGRRHAWLPVFGVVFPTVVGGGILALPVALAPLGPGLAAAATVGIGLVNVLTIGLLALAVVRRADSLPPHARLATLTAQLLGRGAGRLATVVIVILLLGLVVVYALGLSHSLALTVGWSAPAWATAALVVSILLVGFQLRRVLMTAGTAVTVANLLLLAILIVLLGAQVDPVLLTGGPPAPLGVSSFALVFGALMGAYFGHTSVPTMAPAALRADPSGRSLVVGSVAAMAAAMLVNTAWVIVTLGSTPAADYLAAGSTGIDLVSAVAGPVAGWLALLFVILALGVAGMISAFVLGDLAVEQLPLPRTLTVDLVAGAVLRASDGIGNGVTLTLSAPPDGTGVVARAWHGRASASQLVAGPVWDASALLRSVGGQRRGRWLHVDADGPRISVRTTMVLSVERRQASAAVRVLDEGPRGPAVAQLLREPRGTDALAGSLGLPTDEAADLLADLAADGVVTQDPDGTWRVDLGHRRTTAGGRGAPAEAAEPRALDMAPRSPAWLATTPAARLVAVAPLAVALGIVLALQSADATFAGVFALIGTGAFVVVGTTVPLLLAVASRRNADRAVPGGPLDLSAAAVGTILALVVAVCAVYAAVVTQTVAERLAGVAAVVLSLTSLWLAIRHHAFDRSSALVVRVADDAVTATVTDGGIAAPAPDGAPLPPPGQRLTLALDAIPAASPLRILVAQPGRTGVLDRLQVVSTDHSLDVHPADRPGSGTVDLEDAAAPLRVSWVTE